MCRKMIVSVSELEIELSQAPEDDHIVVVSKLEIAFPQALCGTSTRVLVSHSYWNKLVALSQVTNYFDTDCD